RRRLFGSDTSIIMTSATLATQVGRGNSTAGAGLEYFAKRVGAESAVKLQVGSPFDYQRQMNLFVVNKIPEPREPGYREALVREIQRFIEKTHGKAFVLFTNFKLMLDVAEEMETFFN